MNRRQAVQRGLGLFVGVAAAPMVNLNRYRLFGAHPTEYSARAIRLLRENIVIDMANAFKARDFTLPNGKAVIWHWMLSDAGFTEAEYQRYKDSGIDVFAISWDLNRNLIGYWNAFLARYPDRLIRIDGADDFERVRTSGKIGIILSSQDSSHFDDEDEVETCRGLGQLVSGLTHNRSNEIGSYSFDEVDKGLTEFGHRIVDRMNDVGMVIDLSHSSDRTTLDALEASRASVIFSHTNARALNPGHPRCITDEMAKKTASKGGVVGISFIRFLVHDSEPTTIEHLINHFDHVKNLVGIEHVGVGSDFDLDGLDALPKLRDRLYASAPPAYRFHGGRDQIEPVHHSKRMYDFTEALIRRKYTDAEIKLVLGGNFKRVLSEVSARRKATNE